MDFILNSNRDNREESKNINASPESDWCPFDTKKIGKMMLKLGERISDVKLHPYQVPLALRIFDSLLYYDPAHPNRSGDGNTLTALFSRQCLDPETPILTPTGYKPMSAISEGDTVLTLDKSTHELVEDKVISKWESEIPLYTVHFEDGSKIRCGEHHRFRTIDGTWTTINQGMNTKTLVESHLVYPVQGDSPKVHDYNDDTDEDLGLLLSLILQFGTRTPSQAIKKLRKHDRVYTFFDSFEFAMYVAKRFSLPLEDSANSKFKITLELDLDNIDMNLIYSNKFTVLKYLMRNAKLNPYAGNRFEKFKASLKVCNDKEYNEALLLFLRTLGLNPIYYEKHQTINFTDYESLFLLEPFLRFHALSPSLIQYLTHHANKHGSILHPDDYYHLIKNFRGFRGQIESGTHYYYKQKGILLSKAIEIASKCGFARPHCFVDFPQRSFTKVTKIEKPEIDTVSIAMDIETELHNTYIANRKVCHNSGKTETVSVTAIACMVWLPQFAAEFPKDPRFKKFRKGFWCGIFAPVLDQAETMFFRIKERLTSANGKAILEEFQLQCNPKGRQINLTNGSFVFCKPAGEGVNIESKTLHLAIGDESQDISSRKITKSINPMCAATGGTKLFIGTANTIKSYYHKMIQKNISSHLDGKKQNHFQADYEEVLKHNSYYEMSVLEDMESMGYDSDEFKMAYRCLFIFERGMMVDPALMTEYNPHTNPKGMLHSYLDTVPYYHGNEYISIGLDLGKKVDSTVVTAYAIDLANPIETRSYISYKKRILGWLDIIGDDFDAQFEQIYSFISKMQGQTVVVDATGKGEPMFDRLSLALPYTDVIPFVFSQKSKHLLFKSFISDLNSGRIIVPSSPATQETREYKRFIHQMSTMEKEYKGEFLSCHAPNTKGAHDDYPVSAALGAWAAREQKLSIPEEYDTNFLMV